MRYQPGTTIDSHDRKYIVDKYGCWRVLEYKEGSSGWKKSQRINRG
jgi:hypothetical protein